MERQRAYLDHNATAPLRPEAEHALIAALKLSGNASSIHTEGRAARALVDKARDAIATLIGARPANLTFTSGGTESAAMALRPGLKREGGKPVDLLLVGATEHACVLAGHGFADDLADTIPVNGTGLADMAWLEARLKRAAAEGHTALVSVQLANNETGAIQPITQIARLAKAHGALTHCDAVQAVGRIVVDMATLGVDALTISAHKMGGPKGVGVLALADGIMMQRALIRGGGQERSRRAGTENIAAIAGFGAAASAIAASLEAEAVHVAALRDEFERQLMAIARQATIFGKDTPRLPNTSCFAISGLGAQETLILLDLANVSVSSGSACSSGKVAPSHVLKAMGVTVEFSACALRLSLGWSSTQADIDMALQGLEKAISRRNQTGQAAA
ncbi:MAG: cysteine desulfurase family protein [Bosea sp. (in: a-proteobacteria)]